MVARVRSASQWETLALPHSTLWSSRAGWAATPPRHLPDLDHIIELDLSQSLQSV